MQNNHSKNGTIFMTCHGGALAALRIGRDPIQRDDVHLDHGRTSIQTPDALVREALDWRLAESEKARDGLPGRRGSHTR
jgi:hypothetical protein